jgi:hypothetical protein
MSKLKTLQAELESAEFMLCATRAAMLAAKPDLDQPERQEALWNEYTRAINVRARAKSYIEDHMYAMKTMIASDEIADLVTMGREALAWASTGMNFLADASRFELQQAALMLLADDAACYDCGLAMDALVEQNGCYTQSDMSHWVRENT